MRCIERHAVAAEALQKTCHSEPLVFSADVEHGKDDQVSEDKGDHAAKADPTVPEHSRERDVPYRADERDHGHERPDDRSPNVAMDGWPTRKKGCQNS